jgi:hypothetical protein
VSASNMMEAVSQSDRFAFCEFLFLAEVGTRAARWFKAFMSFLPNVSCETKTLAAFKANHETAQAA